MLYPVVREFLAAVAEREHVDPETGELLSYDDEGLLQRIAELRMDVQEEVLSLAGYIKNKEAEIEIISERIAELSALKKRVSSKNELLRTRMLHAMQIARLDKVDSLELSVRIGKYSSLEVDDDFESKLPKAYLRVIVEPNKVDIKKAIKAGEAFSCARNVSRDQTVIRVK